MKKIILLVIGILFSFETFASSFTVPIESNTHILLNSEKDIAEENDKEILGDDDKTKEEESAVAGEEREEKTDGNNPYNDTNMDNESFVKEPSDVSSIDEPLTSIVTEEKALQEEANDLFPVPITQEVEKPLLLTSIEILKELDDASHLFDNAILVSQKNKMSFDDVKTSQQEVEDDEVQAQKNENKVDIQDDSSYIALNENPEEDSLQGEEAFQQKPSSTDDSKDDFIDDFTDNSIDDFLIDIDDEITKQIQDPSINDSSTDPSTNVDSEDFLTFDEEQQIEEQKAKLQQNPPTKSEDIDAKGELSSIVDEDDKVNISRYTDILRGQNIDFSYPGEGWVYLGEENSKRGLNYEKRKMQDGKTYFTFSAETEGNYVLNFSYFDVFSGDFIVDAVSVKVLPNIDKTKKDALVVDYPNKENKKKEEKKRAPNEVNLDADKVGIKTQPPSKKEDKKENKDIKEKESEIEKKPIEPKKKEKEKKDIAKQNVEVTQPKIEYPREKSEKQELTPQVAYKEPEVFANVATLTPENAKGKNDDEMAKQMIGEAQNAIATGDAKLALERLNNFFAVASTNIDEAYLLRGKAYELNSEFKNIKRALEAYKFLTKTFPNSPHRSEADARIRYIEKFFINIK